MSFPQIVSRHASRIAGIIGLLSIAVAAGGCSAVKLGYATLPEVAYWWLDGYVDLEDGQARRLREDLQRLHAWHRGSELPKVVATLERIERLAAQDTTPAAVCAFEPEIRERIAALRDRAEPAIVTNALALTPAQLRHLEQKHARNNREFERDWLRLSPSEQVDKRVKLAADRLDTIYGTLSHRQQADLRRHFETTPFDARHWFAERRRRQQDTMAVLHRLVEQPMALREARAEVHGLLERYASSPDPEVRAYQATFTRDLCRMIAIVHNGASPAQREHAARRLRGWQRDLAELSAAP